MVCRVGSEPLKCSLTRKKVVPTQWGHGRDFTLWSVGELLRFDLGKLGSLSTSVASSFAKFC
jgi:hypothetical protein